MAAAWRLARSLVTFVSEVKQAWPGTTVGTIGDAAHAARRSDHNPADHDSDPDTTPVVTAADVMGQTQAKAVWDHILETRPERVEYMIHAGRKTGADYGWRVLAYTGPNPHTYHTHVSVGRGSDGAPTRPDLFDDPSPWGIADLPDDHVPLPKGGTPMLGLEYNDRGDDVRLLQIMISDIDPTALNADRKLAHNGHWGPGTAAGLAKVIQRPEPVKVLDEWNWRRLWTAWTRVRVTGSTSVWTKDTGAFASADHTHPVTGKLGTGKPTT